MFGCFFAIVSSAAEIVSTGEEVREFSRTRA